VRNDDDAYQIAAGNAGWPFPPSLCYGGTSQFRYRGGRHPPRVPELWMLGGITHITIMTFTPRDPTSGDTVVMTYETWHNAQTSSLATGSILPLLQSGVKIVVTGCPTIGPGELFVSGDEIKLRALIYAA